MNKCSLFDMTFSEIIEDIFGVPFDRLWGCLLYTSGCGGQPDLSGVEQWTERHGRLKPARCVKQNFSQPQARTSTVAGSVIWRRGLECQGRRRREPHDKKRNSRYCGEVRVWRSGAGLWKSRK